VGDLREGLIEEEKLRPGEALLCTSLLIFLKNMNDGVGAPRQGRARAAYRASCRSPHRGDRRARHETRGQQKGSGLVLLSRLPSCTPAAQNEDATFAIRVQVSDPV
jgi:hypothetical protein